MKLKTLVGRIEQLMSRAQNDGPTGLILLL